MVVYWNVVSRRSKVTLNGACSVYAANEGNVVRGKAMLVGSQRNPKSSGVKRVRNGTKRVTGRANVWNTA